MKKKIDRRFRPKTQEEKRKIAAAVRKKHGNDPPEKRRELKGVRPHLAAIYAEMQEKQTIDVHAMGPFAVFECGQHPDGRVVFDNTQTMVPYEMVCVKCGSRVLAKVRDVVDPSFLRQLQPTGS